MKSPDFRAFFISRIPRAVSLYPVAALPAATQILQT
jgi:hypothetical protein